MRLPALPRGVLHFYFQKAEHAECPSQWVCNFSQLGGWLLCLLFVSFSSKAILSTNSSFISRFSPFLILSNLAGIDRVVMVPRLHGGTILAQRKAMNMIAQF